MGDGVRKEVGDDVEDSVKRGKKKKATQLVNGQGGGHFGNYTKSGTMSQLLRIVSISRIISGVTHLRGP